MQRNAFSYPANRFIYPGKDNAHNLTIYSNIQIKKIQYLCCVFFMDVLIPIDIVMLIV